MEGQRGRAVAFDQDGKQIKKFSGDGGKNHQRNFIDAVRKQDASILNAPVAVGHLSTGWCNLGNITFQAGSAYSKQQAQRIARDSQPWTQLLDDMQQLLDAHGIDMESSQIRLSPILELDPKSEKFIGRNAEVANPHLKRKYRKPFVVREVTV